MKNYHAHQSYKKQPPTKNQVRFVQLRLEGKTIDSIAKELDVSPKTLNNWKTKPWFRELDAEYRANFYQECLGEMVQSFRYAKVEIDNILVSEDTSNRDKLRAIELLSNLCDKWLDHRNLERLTQLEQRQTEFMDNHTVNN